ncbi:MAG: hypothetical protein JNJ59_19115, partial [Deltaproteobacteria bacterium]|nr:hypothetical protein [Deltaproteobacteria bacterium]
MQTHEPPAPPTSRAPPEANGPTDGDGHAAASAETAALRAELADCRRRLALLTNLSSTIVYIFDVERRAAEWVSRDVRRELGYTPEELADMGAAVVPFIIHSDDLAVVNARLA